jgi:hypothetical protein
VPERETLIHQVRRHVEILGFMQNQCATQNRVKRARWRYPTYEHLTLAHGTAWHDVAPLPPHLAGPPKECFSNAMRLALDTPDEYTYVEGWASNLIVTHHGWVVDRDGRVLDPTWAPSQESRIYFGVPFNKTWLLKSLCRSKLWGVLYCDPMVLRDKPEAYLAVIQRTGADTCDDLHPSV